MPVLHQTSAISFGDIQLTPRSTTYTRLNSCTTCLRGLVGRWYDSEHVKSRHVTPSNQPVSCHHLSGFFGCLERGAEAGRGRTGRRRGATTTPKTPWHRVASDMIGGDGRMKNT